MFRLFNETAASAPAASDLLRETRFDALLVDILLREANGLAMVAAARVADHLPPCVISISAMDRYEARPLSKAAGCHNHLAKPFQAAELLGALDARASN